MPEATQILVKKPDFNKTHPELNPGEVVLCNAGEQGISSLKKLWKTMRVGDVAYSTEGIKLGGLSRPIIVSEEEKKQHDLIFGRIK